MSGIEIAGIALAILPLLISAANHFEDVARPFKRYRHYGEELKTFQLSLGTERTIFKRQVLLLLIEAGHPVDEDVFDPNHQTWTSQEVEEKLLSYLGKAKDVCTSILLELDAQLTEIGGKEASFAAAIEQDPQASIVNGKVTLSKFDTMDSLTHSSKQQNHRGN